MNQKPIAWVTCGDVEYTPDDYPPNWSSITTSEEQAKYWMEECCIRVKPIYLGETINPVKKL